ncbi:hypothetical protein GLOTRDRAFT_139907 [Gloeophyllum trabeum ATCC 11539]|uniref:BZIP domain-containing protein n=1 Tax=Gloeophyllum trabeum (strain ATCC 11539 / FP-39264 / Madison 617) TaxID=670483 RepID=S7Q1J2_GLOTA|nr:uncharacterized protein GLOTRDRAFT_139907 [Gloeophyllum trabeum ATCC 11539]EPQ53841.1 hypothetical protein GLOTRDRAFT_139907 [Gloeophyllum trabeum ATCC 11539]
MANCKYKDDKERKEAKNRQNQAWYRRKRAKLLERAFESGGDRSSSGSRSLTPGGAEDDAPSRAARALDSRLQSIRARCAAAGYDEPVSAFLARFEAAHAALRASCCTGAADVDEWLAGYERQLRAGSALLDDVQALVRDGADVRAAWAELMEVSMKVHWLMAVIQVRLDLVRRAGAGGVLEWGACTPSGPALC